MGLIDRIMAKRAAAPKWVAAANETLRVVNLPTRSWDGRDLTARYRKPGSTMQLRPIQSELLHEIEQCRGAFGLVGVGHGKTIPSFVAGAALGARLTLLFVPAKLRQKTHDDLTELQRHWRMPVIRVLSYNELSTDSYLLDNITAGYKDSELCVVCDEAQALKLFTAARTKRMERFLTARPGVPFVAMSGTMTDKSLKECAHLAEWALGDRSPIPRPKNIDRGRPGERHLEAWSNCIDVKGQPTPSDWRYLAPLLAGLPTGLIGQARQTQARIAFQRRLKASPGVVRTEAGSLAIPLHIRGLDITEAPAVVDLRTDVLETGETPDGEVLVDDISKWRFQRQLSCGFYYRWDWPDGLIDWEWMDSRARWMRHVRAELETAAGPGYDSPALIARAVMHGRAPHLLSAWTRWAAVKDRPAPPVVPVWVDPTWLKRATAGDTSRTIIWYESRAVADGLEQLGIRTVRAGSEPPSDGLEVALSVRSHGTGYNLQAWSSSLVLEPPSGGKAWEQMTGRLHRAGQGADSVTFSVYQHTDAFIEALVSARRDARYIEDTTGNHQKLNAAAFGGQGL